MDRTVDLSTLSAEEITKMFSDDDAKHQMLIGLALADNGVGCDLKTVTLYTHKYFPECNEKSILSAWNRIKLLNSMDKVILTEKVQKYISFKSFSDKILIKWNEATPPTYENIDKFSIMSNELRSAYEKELKENPTKKSKAVKANTATPLKGLGF